MGTRLAGLSAVVVVAGLLIVGAGVAIGADSELTFYACSKGNRIQASSLRVNDPPDCKGKGDLVSWSAGGPPSAARSASGDTVVIVSPFSDQSVVECSGALDWVFAVTCD